MRLPLLLPLGAALLHSPPARAQDWAGYKKTSLEAITATWDKITRKEHLGVTIMEPESVHLVVTYAAAPKPCKTGLLNEIFVMNGRKDALKDIPITQCVTLAAANRRNVSAFIQDMIVPGLEKDAKLGGRMEVYAVLVGYMVHANQAENNPILVINRFEPL